MKKLSPLATKGHVPRWPIFPSFTNMTFLLKKQTQARKILLTAEMFHLDQDGVSYRINNKKKNTP